MKIFETSHFMVESPEKPHVTRNDGGHIKISPKISVIDRQKLSPEQSVELAWLTDLIGEAFLRGMKKQVIELGRINYQDNSNWTCLKPSGPYLHVNLYGRAIDASIQPYGQSLNFPHGDEFPEFYANNEPLNTDDIESIISEIENLLKENNRYDKDKWRF